MKIILFGLGSIGLRHAKLLKEMGRHELIAFRSGKKGAGNPLGIREISSWQEMDKIRPQAALISNPTSLHIETALPCAEREIPLFVEKPINNSTKELERLLALVRKAKTASYVAYVLRFHPVITALRTELEERKNLTVHFVCKSWLPDWRKGQDGAQSYSARKEMGGGAILDVSHEFDLAAYLLGPVESIKGNFQRREAVTVDAEDYVEADVACGSGRARITIDIASRQSERVITVKSGDGTYRADLLKGSLSFSSPKDSWQKEYAVERDDPYRSQLRYFLDNIENPRMMNHLAEAAPLFRKIIAFREGITP